MQRASTHTQAETQASPVQPARPVAAAPGRHLGNQATLRRLSSVTPRMQARLAVGPVNDPLEQEADSVADQVMRMPENSATVQRKCAACQEEDEKLMRKESAAGPAGPVAAPASVQAVLGSPGRPLEAAVRSGFEAKFGQDFSRVRIHEDRAAADSARDVGALAYTVGPHVAFALGQYRPGSREGQTLLAHELAHVVQQSGEGEPRLRRKELPDEETPKEWPLPNQFNEGDEQCRWEEGDLKCYKVKCIQTEENKTHCFYDGPSAPEPDKPQPDKKAPPAQAPAAKQAVIGKDSKKQDYVVYENEIRVGGTRPWRNNNPGNFDKPSDHPKNIGTDGRFLIFPDPATGKQEMIDSVKAHGTSSIRTFITAHAPPSENDTEQYITDVLSFMNSGAKIGECQITKPAKPVSDGTVIGNLNAADQASLAMAMARKEGWCDVVQKKALYTCQSASIPDEYKKKLACP